MMVPAAKSNDREVAIDLSSMVTKVHVTKTEYIVKNNTLHNRQ